MTELPLDFGYFLFDCLALCFKSAQREFQQVKRMEQLLQQAQRQRAGATQSAQGADEQPQ